MLERRWFPWAVVGFLVACALPFGALVAHLVAQDQAESPPSCYGIGFGCVPDPWTTAFLLGLLVYGPAVLLLGGLLGVAELFGPRLAKARSVLALVGAAATLALAMMAVVRVAQ